VGGHGGLRGKASQITASTVPVCKRELALVGNGRFYGGGTGSFRRLICAMACWSLRFSQANWLTLIRCTGMVLGAGPPEGSPKPFRAKL